jgi:sugar-specific transcriptional regulator TrmB
MATDAHIAALEGFGFTETEARIYCFLLEESPATGYRIAHAIGKAAANTYKALTSLEQKGAIQVDTGDSKLARAVPPEELLAALGRSFDARKEKARNALAKLHTPSTDHRVYQLGTAEQAIERAIAMLARAEDIAVMDITPAAVPQIAAAIEVARSRGVRIAAITYVPHPAFEDGQSVVALEAERVLATWPGQQLNLVVDARETLFAFFNDDCTQVNEAIWTNSRYLSVMHYNAITAELAGQKYRELMPDTNKSIAEIESLSLTRMRPAGLRDLLGE